MSLNEIKQQTQQIVEEVLELSNLQKGQIFVLGLSSSEVIGGHIGKNSSLEVGEVIVETILDILEPKGMYLAVQGCEHLNRALVVERELAIQKDLEIVNVLPSLHAGGSGQLAAFKSKWNLLLLRQAWISVIRLSACISNMCRFQLDQYFGKLGKPMLRRLLADQN